MTISIGLFFHLLTHAWFKSSLFVCAGGVIHSIGDPQHIRFIGVFSEGAPWLSG